MWKGSSSSPSSVEGGSPKSHSRAIRCQLAVAPSWPSTPSVSASMRRASIACGGIVSRRISCQWRERGSPKSIRTCETSARSTVTSRSSMYQAVTSWKCSNTASG